VEIEISHNFLVSLIIKQLDSLFFFYPSQEKETLKASIDIALDRTSYCFSHSNSRFHHYHRESGERFFNPLNSDHYAIFLYYLANSIFMNYPEAGTLADRVFYLNKALNGLDLYYEVMMPEIFFAVHPVGSVIGIAEYADFFLFSQNCTVGANKDICPKIGQNVQMMPGSAIVGNCTVEDNVIISAYSYVKDTDIKACSIVFGMSPNLVIKSREPEYFKRA